MQAINYAHEGRQLGRDGEQAAIPGAPARACLLPGLLCLQLLLLGS
jgi:hypothetical protein